MDGVQMTGRAFPNERRWSDFAHEFLAFTTVYTFSGTKVIGEYALGANPNSPTREYIYSGSALLATIEGSTTKYHHVDHLSVRLTADISGSVLGQQGHYPYGESWYSASATTKWQFTTYERDGATNESGNDYAMARYHVNRLGRFNSPDPLAGSVANPQSLNRYAYVLNDPVNSIDPMGLECFRACVTAGGGTTCEWVCDNPFDASRGPVRDDGFGSRRPLVTLAEWDDIHGRPPKGEGGDPGSDKKERDVINAALKQKNLAKCLNEFFGPGTILTNDNLPHIDASKDLLGGAAGRTVVDQVPETGRGTVQIDRGVFRDLPANDLFLVWTYLHETANVLAIQRFTNIQPRGARARLGPRGGPPSAAQANHPWDSDIGQQFEECLSRK